MTYYTKELDDYMKKRAEQIPSKRTSAFLELYRTDEEYLQIRDFSLNHNDFIKNLDRKIYRPNVLPISYRVINSWEEIGLIENQQLTAGMWRKFSMIDRLWIEIIVRLRRFGLSLSQILKIKNDLQFNDDGTRHFTLEYYYYHFIHNNVLPYLVYTEFNQVDIATLHELNGARKDLSLGNSLQIDLAYTLAELTPKKIGPFYKHYGKYENNIENKYQNLLQELRSGDYESVKITFKDGEIKLIEKTEILNADMRIIDVLKSDKFQNIEIIQHNAKTVSLKRTIKKKPPTGK